MSQRFKSAMKAGSAPSLRSRLVLGTTLATTAFIGGYLSYVRRAEAACNPSGGSGEYVCEDATTQPQSFFNDASLTLTTSPGFSIETDYYDAIQMTTIGAGSTGLTFRDDNTSTITGADSGISATNAAAAMSITTTGAVRGIDDNGIEAFNGVDATDLTISAVDARGGIYGILAEQNGTGALRITATGDVVGDTEDGIDAETADSATSLTINARNVTGNYTGIYALHNGSEALAITATGTVTGNNDVGIDARNYGTSLTITVGNQATVTGVESGILALHQGTGNLSITVSGDVEGDGVGIAAVNNSDVAGSTTTVTLTSGASAIGSDVGVGLTSTVGRDATLENAGSISGATGVFSSTTGVVVITNQGSITGTGGTAIDTNVAASATFNQQGGTVTGGVSLSAAGADTFNVSGGTITGSLFGLGGGNTFNISGGTIQGSLFAGSQDDEVNISGNATIQGNASGPDAVGLEDGNDVFNMTGGTLGGAVSGGNGDDELNIGGGTVGSFVFGNAGNDRITVSGGSIDRDVEAETVVLSGGNIHGNVTGVTDLVINDPLSSNALNVDDGTVFSGNNANATIINTDLSAGGTKSHVFTGFDTVTVDPSTIAFSTGTIGINQLNLQTGSTLFVTGNVTMTGSANLSSSTLSMANGSVADRFTLGGLVFNNSALALDINQRAGQADQIRAASVSALNGSTLAVNLIGAPVFNQVTTIPIIFTNGGVNGAFTAGGLPGSQGSLFSYALVNGPNGLSLQITPNNVGLAVITNPAINVGTVDTALDALDNIHDDAIASDLGLAVGSQGVQISPTVGVFASGVLAHTEHSGFTVTTGDVVAAGPDFDVDEFSAAISIDFNAAKHFGFDQNYGLNLGIFAGYASTDITLGSFEGFDAVGDATNKSGIFGGYGLFREGYSYALLSGMAFIGETDINNNVLNTTGSYGTTGYAVAGSVGHIFKWGEKTRFDLRGGLLGVSFDGDEFTDTGGNRYGTSEISFGAFKFEPGIYADYQLENGMTFSPYARADLQQRFGYTNTASIDSVDIEFDDADFSGALSTGFNLKTSEKSTVSAEIRGKWSSDSSTILGKVGWKVAF